MVLRGEAERQAVNHPIQSPSSDVVLLAHNTLFDMQSLADMSFDHFRLVLFVHDELVFEVREDLDISKYVKRVKEAMENPPLERDFGIKMLVPLATSPKVGHNLASMKEFN
jgi:DNA polymerase I-like protein with 3'-5' exonuclease and polymerase domains